MKPRGAALLGLLLFLPLLAAAAVPPAADIRRDFSALAGVASPRGITGEEWEGASFALFQAADKNKDNLLSADELGASAITRGILATADENRDGQLSVTEFMQLRRAVFRASDMDRDDSLTYFEFELLVLLGQTGWTDANRNGRIEVSELKAALQDAFGMLDTSRDRKLAREEAAYMGAAQWTLCDENQDQGLTVDEFVRGYLLALGAI